jgi:hypothetical protein
MIPQSRIERFEKKTTRVPVCDCVLWVGGVNEHGYGVFWNGVKLEKAHRFALRCAGVDVPADADVLHTCDVPCCVNPAHLYVGDAKANVSDMWARRRATVQHRRGTSQTQAKLTDEKAAEVRRIWREEKPRPRQKDIGARFGVSQTLVWRVIHGMNWFADSGVIVTRGRGR